MDNSIVTIKTNEEMHSDFEKTMIRMVNAHSDEMRKKHQIEEAEKRVMRVERNYKKMQQKKMERRQKFFKLFKVIIGAICCCTFPIPGKHLFNMTTTSFGLF